MYFLNQTDVANIKHLFEYARDNAYFEISSWKGMVDIRQYSAKYKEVHLVTVPREKLDQSLCLGFAKEW